ncbi:TRAFAC clade GTPase domain-containing protein [Phytohabitans rumicis]|uniref:Double-GTPase 2 domain-containing protein n=1 Tax=Phytohabitans rumicis TaxID=1076125 RepID=A0A6V8KN45_9ACTN|nr:hypothetical protein [Phytohabitans rumicis]GFJ86593.1 hypothetical protein Prum_002350 [Phytohabitans rumicis]
MRPLFALAGLVVLALTYLFVAAAVLVFLAPPAVLVGIAAGAGAGALIGLHRSLAVLAGRVPAGYVRTPDDVVAGRIAGGVRKESIRRDHAWPQYFAVQIRWDVTAVTRAVAATVSHVWARTLRPLAAGETRRILLFGWPLFPPVLAALVGVSVGAAAAVTLTAVLAGAAAALVWGMGLPAVGLLRAVDGLWQSVFRASGSCQHCFHVTSLPAYRCPGPHSAEDREAGLDLHRDIRPGRLGVLWRRCGCGHRLPTTVLRAAHSVQACCPACGEPLPSGAAAMTDVRVPVFGAASAGKTHLIMAGLVALSRAGTRRGTVGFLDEHSRTAYEQYRALVDSGQSAAKTSAAVPVAVTVRLRGGGRAALVHFFDAAGETLADSGQNGQLAYLDQARTLTFVLDPFSIPDVRDQAAAGYPDLLSEANPATYDVADAYHVTVNRLRLYGVDTHRQRLAFVVSKADLLARLPIASGLDPDSGSVRSWLVTVGLDNLVTIATRDFGEVRFFLVSARDPERGAAIEPFRWLLAADRVSV